MKKNVWTSGAAAAAVMAGILLASPLGAYAAERIPEGVYAGEMSLAGLTEAEADEKVREYVAEKQNQVVTLDVNGTKVQTTAGDLGLSWTNQEELEQLVSDSEIKGCLIKRYMKKKDLEENQVRAEIELSVSDEKVTAFVSEQCAGAVKEAKDASIKKENGQFVITPSQTGIAVDLAATEAALSQALGGQDTGAVRVEATVAVTEPKIHTEDLSTIKDVLGTFSTDFSSSSQSRATNLAVGSGKINGHVLMPGETLSGYECMHPFTTANGYRSATAYENGRTVDSIGGGVCQISTTLYNAALFAELDIVQRQNHSMTVSYVKPSMDAAIAGTYKDLKIRNPYDTPIYVEGYTSGKTLTFTIYGKETRPSNRTIAFESETVQTIDPGEPTEQVDASLAPGQRVRVQSSHTGLKSKLYKCVYVDGKQTERTLLNSDTYAASKAIYRVGPAAPAQTVPAETAPPATEAPVQTQAPESTAAPAETAPPETAPAETAPPETEAQPSAAPGSEFGPGMETLPAAQ